MPKVSRAGEVAKSRLARQHNPLSEEYVPTEASFKQKTPKRKRAGRDDDLIEATQIDAAESKRILRIGRELIRDEEAAQAEFRKELGIEDEQEASLGDVLVEKAKRKQADADAAAEANDDEEEWSDDSDEEYDDSNDAEPEDLKSFYGFHPTFDNIDGFSRLNPSGGNTGDDEITPEDAVDNDGPAPPGGSRNLADMILEKIAEQEAAQAAAARRQAGQDDPAEIPPRVVEAYTAVGAIMSRQNVGKLPKPFTMISTLPLGMQVMLLEITEPERWTPYMAYCATRLFISKPPAVALQFLNQALLPAIQHRIENDKVHRLHPTLYRALKKALYKPAAFFKGIVFPMLESGCTMREAHIVASVVVRVSIPVLHSAAALMRLTEISADKPAGSWNTRGGTGGGGGPVNHFIKVLIEKKYALPYKVIDALVFHFLRFRPLVNALAEAEAEAAFAGADNAHMHESRRGVAGRGGGNSTANLTREESLPLLWHQSFLAFAQRYRDDITEDQREALLDLIVGKGHRSIGPEIRRELLAGRGRGVSASEAPGMVLNGGDDTMEGIEVA